MPLFIGNNDRRKGDGKMKKTTDFILTIIMLIGITLVTAVMPTEKDAQIYDDTLRLHILANSDSAEDQDLKYKIRDRLLARYGEILSSASCPDEAKSITAEMVERIEGDVGEWLTEYGYEYGCEVTLGTEWYETREYDGFTLPRGYYTSLRVMLGDAEGRNWWCVMYPPLCLDIATEDAPGDDAVIGYTKEEYALISADGYNVKLKILEVFSDAFSKNG